MQKGRPGIDPAAAVAMGDILADSAIDGKTPFFSPTRPFLSMLNTHERFQ
jgi:hypothetical protein